MYTNGYLSNLQAVAQIQTYVPASKRMRHGTLQDTRYTVQQLLHHARREHISAAEGYLGLENNKKVSDSRLSIGIRVSYLSLLQGVDG